MKDENRTKDQLIKELKELHQQIRDLKNFEVEHKRIEKVSLQYEERYRILAENSMDGIYIISTEAGFEYVNPAFEEICGYRSEELCSRDFNFLDLIHPDDKELVQKKKETRVKGKNLPWIYEFRIVTKRKEVKFVEVNTVPLPGVKGEILGILRDITERKRAEQRLRERKKELEIKSSNLEEVNTALRVLLKRREEDKGELEENILYNVEELVVPYMEKLKKIGLSDKQEILVGILENNLKEIISPFSRRMTTKYHNFTPAEIRVADFVRKGKRNKEIAEILNVSSRTVAFHRENIRKKLGIKKNKTNLASYLSSLP